MILWAWTALLSGFVLFPLFVHQVNAFIPFGAAALGVGLYTLFHPGLRKGNGDGRRRSTHGGLSPDRGRLEASLGAEVVRSPNLLRNRLDDVRTEMR